MANWTVSSVRLALTALIVFVSSSSAVLPASKDKRLLGLDLSLSGLLDLSSPTVTITNPKATIVGTSNNLLGLNAGAVDSFIGIPYAKPPVGPLRLKPPQPLSGDLGRVDATTLTPASCPQFVLSSNIGIPGAPDNLLAPAVNSPFFRSPIISGQ